MPRGVAWETRDTGAAISMKGMNGTVQNRELTIIS
jgi:hypothetical protein